MMHNLRRRIEVLERARPAACQDRRVIATRALDRLWPSEVESLIGACGAEREARQLRTEESAAKQAYMEALTRECRWAGYPSIEGFEDALDICDAMHIVLALRMSGPGLEFAERALEAQQRGLAATQEESTALQMCNTEWTRLWRLAGMGGPAGAEVPEDGGR
jgi:hypothetical protein